MLVNVNETQVGLETRENVNVTTMSVRKGSEGAEIMMLFVSNSKSDASVPWVLLGTA